MTVPEHIWAYCDTCDETCPVNGTDLRDYLTDGAPHSYIDLICAVCHNLIATISIGPADGSPPVQPPVQLRPREQTEPADAEPDSPLRRVYTVDLRRQGERIQARIQDIQGLAFTWCHGVAETLSNSPMASDGLRMTTWLHGSNRQCGPRPMSRSCCW
jgi:hypothetical protein